MDFPALPYTRLTPPPALLKAINVQPVEVYESTFDLLFIFESEDKVQEAWIGFYYQAHVNYI